MWGSIQEYWINKCYLSLPKNEYKNIESNNFADKTSLNSNSQNNLAMGTLLMNQGKTGNFSP
jgi:hypothetical protein